MNGPSTQEVLPAVREETPREEAGGFFSDEEFQEHVKVVMNAMRPENDPEGENFRRCLAETHAYLVLFDRGVRQMQRDMISAGGPIQMMKQVFGLMRKAG